MWLWSDSISGHFTSDIRMYFIRIPAFTQCWLNIGPASATLAQHSTNIASTSRVLRSSLMRVKFNLNIPSQRDYPDHDIPHSRVLLCKGKRQYLLTCKVSRYCLLPSHGSVSATRLVYAILPSTRLDQLFSSFIFKIAYPRSHRLSQSWDFDFILIAPLF